MPHFSGVAEGISDIIRSAGQAPDIRLAADGSVGAAVLAMRAVGMVVDEAMVATISASIKSKARSLV
jgi:hypothetical protein